MRGTIILKKTKLMECLHIIEIMEDHYGSIDEVEISFGEKLPSGVSANWVKPILRSSEKTEAET